MTPLAKRKLERMLDHGRASDVRKILAAMLDDKDAVAMLADMKVSYPITALDRANEISKSLLFWGAIGFGTMLGTALLIGILQFIVAQLSAK